MLVLFTFVFFWLKMSIRDFQLNFCWKLTKVTGVFFIPLKKFSRLMLLLRIQIWQHYLPTKIPRQAAEVRPGQDFCMGDRRSDKHVARQPCSWSKWSRAFLNTAGWMSLHSNTADNLSLSKLLMTDCTPTTNRDLKIKNINSY